jgi:hypothetical protein
MRKQTVWRLSVRCTVWKAARSNLISDEQIQQYPEVCTSGYCFSMLFLLFGKHRNQWIHFVMNVSANVSLFWGSAKTDVSSGDRSLDVLSW